jgi:DNA-binding cell septation regulator SpoVG
MSERTTTAPEIIVDVRLIKNPGSLRASASITFNSDLGEMSIRGFRIIENGGNLWVGFPQESFEGKDRKWVNIPHLEVSRRTKKAISEAILDAYEDEAAEKSDDD